MPHYGNTSIEFVEQVKELEQFLAGFPYAKTHINGRGELEITACIPNWRVPLIKLSWLVVRLVLKAVWGLYDEASYL